MYGSLSDELGGGVVSLDFDELLEIDKDGDDFFTRELGDGLFSLDFDDSLMTFNDGLKFDGFDFCELDDGGFSLDFDGFLTISGFGIDDFDALLGVDEISLTMQLFESLDLLSSSIGSEFAVKLKKMAINVTKTKFILIKSQ